MQGLVLRVSLLIDIIDLSSSLSSDNLFDADDPITDQLR